MTTVGKTLVGLLGAGLLATGPAFASSDVENELAEMRELMTGLKEKVEAQEEQLEHQGQLLEESQEVVRRQQRDTESLSSLAEFWNAIDVNMSVAGSYAWNFNQPQYGLDDIDDLDQDSGQAGPFEGAGANQGMSGGFYPFHGDHNSFQVDQVYLDIGKEATDESRAGFMFTVLYGNTAAFLGQGSPAHARTAGTNPAVLDDTGEDLDSADSTSDYYIHQAYVNYLAPVGEGVDVRFGKFATLVGAEVADTTQNFNITMGNLYNLLQPIDHVGLLTSTNVGPVSLAAGIVNQGSLSFSSPDINSEKTYLGQIGFGTDMLGAGFTVLYGAEGGALGYDCFGCNDRRTGLLDFLATYESDAFEAWVNADYFWVEGSSAAAWGVAIAGRVPITDQFSAALRAEYVRDKVSDTFGDVFGIEFFDNHSEIYGLTGTLAYEVVENLTVRGELRWDRVVEDGLGAPEEFISRTPGGSTYQIVGLAQVVYAF